MSQYLTSDRWTGALPDPFAFPVLFDGLLWRRPLAYLIDAAIIGAMFGAWAASLVAMSVPNSRPKAFQKEIEAGKLLLMVDVPPSRIQEIQDLVHRRHPEATAHGVEPTLPAFP